MAPNRSSKGQKRSYVIKTGSDKIYILYEVRQGNAWLNKVKPGQVVAGLVS